VAHFQETALTPTLHYIYMDMMESIEDRTPKARQSSGRRRPAGRRTGSEAETDVGGDDGGGQSSPPRPAHDGALSWQCPPRRSAMFTVHTN